MRKKGTLIVFTPIRFVPERWMTLSYYSLVIQFKLLLLFIRSRQRLFLINNLEWFRVVDFSVSSVYDLTDDWIAEPNLDVTVKARREIRENYLLTHSNFVTSCSNELILRKSKQININKFIHIPNGVSKDDFAKQGEFPRTLKQSFQNQAVYIGSLHESRIDINLVESLANELQQRGFGVTLVGPNFFDEKITSRLIDGGVTFAGSVSYSEVPIVMNSAGVLIVPHLINSFTESLDPIKLYESLCTDTVTIATNVAVFREFNGAISICDNSRFVSECLTVLEKKIRRIPTPELALDWKEVSERFAEVFDSLGGEHINS